MKKQSYSQTSFSDRLQTTTRYLGRTRRHSTREFALAIVAPQTWLKLTPSRPLDGLTLYSQSLHQLAKQSKSYYRLPERTYMIVQYRH